MTLNEYKEKITDIRTRGLQAANAGRIADAEALKASNERSNTGGAIPCCRMQFKYGG